MAQRSASTHLVVVGGSIVGSVVAAMLARHFDEVTIVDRDSVPSAPASRPAVPQGRHVHALLARGAKELEQLFPGFLGEMTTRGAELLDMGRDVAWLTPAGWGIPFDSDIVLCCATRDLIESHVRYRTLQLPNVTLRDNCSVTGLLTDSGRQRITGVRVRDRGASSRNEHDIAADLVVCATGRGSQLPEWLEQAGRPRVRESVVDARMAYASRFYRAVPDALRQWRAAYVQAALPTHPRGGIMFPVEGDRWHLTLFGYGGDAPPTDEDGFRTFTRQLRSRILADAINQATPLTPIVGYRRTENRRRHFEEMAGWPAGLVALGDAVCCFDPVYGQGMSTGILSAMALRDLIATQPRDHSGFATQVQRRIASVVTPAWELATGEDLRLSSTTGGRLGSRARLLQRYMDRVFAAATMDARVRVRLLSTMHMLTSPATLMHPVTVARVVRHCLMPKIDLRADLWPEMSDAYAGNTN